MSSEFKSFLKGLLNKVPSERLSWPDLLNHPFIAETDAETVERKIRLEKYNRWAGGDSMLKEISHYEEKEKENENTNLKFNPKNISITNDANHINAKK